MNFAYWLTFFLLVSRPFKHVCLALIGGDVFGGNATD